MKDGLRMKFRSDIPKMIFSAFLAYAVFAFVGTSKAAAALKLPDQFLSSNAVVILGLENETSISEKTVDKAARRLLSKFHPDRFDDKMKHSDADRLISNTATGLIQKAREALIDYIRLNPDFNPQKYTANFDPQKRGFTNGQGGAYSWDETFDRGQSPPPRSERSFGNGTSVVTGQHFSSSLRGTWFEFLYEHPGFLQAVIPMNGVSVSIDAYDVLLILRPETFPQIEVRYISKPTVSGAPQLVESVYATYTRGHYAGLRGQRHDAIVFSDGRHLINGLETGRPITPFVATSFGDTAGNFIINSSVDFFLTELGQDGFHTGNNFEMYRKDPFAFLPAQKPVEIPGWKKLALPTNTSVIRLGYTPSKVTCQSLFE